MTRSILLIPCPRCNSELSSLRKDNTSHGCFDNKVLFCKKCRDIILLNDNIGVIRI